MRGRVTSLKTVHSLAPMSRAASSSAPSKRLNTAIMTRKPKGSVHTTCTPSPVDHQAGEMPTCLMRVAIPRLSRMPGTMMPVMIV